MVLAQLVALWCLSQSPWFHYAFPFALATCVLRGGCERLARWSMNCFYERLRSHPCGAEVLSPTRSEKSGCSLQTTLQKTDSAEHLVHTESPLDGRSLCFSTSSEPPPDAKNVMRCHSVLEVSLTPRTPIALFRVRLSTRVTVMCDPLIVTM